MTYAIAETFYTLQGEGYHAGDPPEAFTPDWPDSERTHWQMYEDTTEGTPISPVCETPDELATWLFENAASAFGSMTATKERWLEMINRHGWAPSCVIDGSGIRSGVDAVST